MDKPITDFIGKHHVMTLATLSTEGEGVNTHIKEGVSQYEKGEVSVNTPPIVIPYCSNLFYAWDGSRFVVTSSDSTQHARDVLKNCNVAVSIVLETRVVGKIQGLQLRGNMYRPTSKELAEAKKTYLKTFPYAIFMDLELWIIEPVWAKLTDNRLGFGKKLVWNKE